MNKFLGIELSDDENTAHIFNNATLGTLLKPSETLIIIEKLKLFCDIYTDAEIDLYNQNIVNKFENFVTTKKDKDKVISNDGYIYIFECNGLYKIGLSKDVNRRFKELDKRPYKLNLIYYKRFNNVFTVEQEIHKYMRNNFKCVGNEWYDFDEDLQFVIDFINSMEEYMNEN